MTTFRCAHLSPFLVLAASVVAFGVWVARDAAQPLAQAHEARLIRKLPPPPDPGASTIEAQLNTLKPGVPRLTAEQQLMTLPRPEVDPIDLSGGKPVLRERYRIDLRQPVAPLTLPPSCAFVPGPHVLTLEFDAGAAGHPIARVRLAPDPGR